MNWEQRYEKEASLRGWAAEHLTQTLLRATPVPKGVREGLGETARTLAEGGGLGQAVSDGLQESGTAGRLINETLKTPRIKQLLERRRPGVETPTPYMPSDEFNEGI